MIALVRNCAHGSEVSTYLVDDGHGRRFVKVALTAEGRQALLSEIAGWTWYQSRRCPARAGLVCRTLRRDRHVVRIEIDALDGRQWKAADGLRANSQVVARAIDQYCAIWPANPQGLAPLHGDFSCDNLIDTPDGLFVIDWEHFHPDCAPWGFDAVYLLCESLYFHGMRHGKPGDECIRLVAAHIHRLRTTRTLPQQVLAAPLRFTREFIRGNLGLWRGDLARHPLKLPILSMPEDGVTAIDGALRAALDRLS
jgi:hypothetical protein